MSWLRIDDKMARHPKVSPLSDAAFRLHIHALAYCAEYETDGFIDEALLDDLSKHSDKLELVKELTKPRRVPGKSEPSVLWKRTDGGWMIHDYLDWNPSHAELEAKRKGAQERTRRARSPSVRANMSRTGDVSNALQHANDPKCSDTPARARGGDGSGDREQGGAESKSENGEGAGGGQSGSTAAPPADASLEAQCAAVAAPLSLGRPEAYQLTTDVFCELWEAKYGRQYELDWRSGPYSEIESFRKVARAAVDRGGDRAEEYLRHWFAQFLADKGRNNRLVDERHPARMLSYDINKWEDPKPEKPKQPTAPAAPVELASAATIRQILGNKIPPPRKAAPQPVLQPEASEAKP